MTEGPLPPALTSTAPSTEPPAHAGRSPFVESPPGDPARSRLSRPKQRYALLAIRFVIGAGAVLFALLVVGFLVSNRPEPPRRPTQDSSMIVRTVVAQTVPIARSWEGYATVQAKTLTEVSAEVSAAVIERPDAIRVGAAVVAGQTIVRLDNTDAVQRLASATALAESLEAQLAQLSVELESTQESLALADEGIRLQRVELERLKQATAGQAAAPIEIERLERQLTASLREREGLNQQQALIPPRRRALEAQLAQQEAAVALAQLDVQRTRIISPIDGVIDAVFVDVGQRVSVGTPIARVVDPTRLEVPVRVPVTAAAELAPGDPAVLRVSTMPGHRWQGEVVRLSPQADAETRTVEVFVEVQQGVSSEERAASPMLRPGQFVIGRVSRSDVHSRIVVPRGAIRSDRVIVMNSEGRAEPRPVRISHYIDERWPDIDAQETEWAVLLPVEETASGRIGVSAGERIVTSNLDDIRRGMLLRSLDSIEPTAERATDIAAGNGEAAR